MTSEKTNGTTALPATRWSDEEKVRILGSYLTSSRFSLYMTNEHSSQIALLLSVIKSSSKDKITWANVDVPAGRTTGSSQKQYEGLLKAAASVPMTSGNAIAPAKKRAAGGAKKDATEDALDDNPTPSKKRGRKPKKVEQSEATVSKEEDVEEESPTKKVKVEKEEDLTGDEVDAIAAAEYEGV